jgi:hypothetical protein
LPIPIVAGPIVAGGLLYHRLLGAAGSALIVLDGFAVGVTPLGDIERDLPVIRALSSSTVLSVFVAYVGLTMLLLAWWRIGGLVRAPGGPSWRELASTVAWWGVPFAVGTPIFSGDVYSYLAQGAMTTAGIDAYRVGPAALGGPLAVNVPEIWQHSPAPYGPVFLDLAGTVTDATDQGIWAGILGMRALAILGVGLLIWAVPKLAAFWGVPPAAAVWLGVLNPLVLLHLIGDAHNEAVMLGLMSVGLVLALQRRPALGVVLITLGTLVKAPAGLAIAFVIPIWASQLADRDSVLADRDSVRSAGRGRWLDAGVRTVAVAAVTALVVTALAGTGFGWVRTLNTPTRAHTWMSITTDLGWAVGSLLHRVIGLGVDQTRQGFWLAGLLVAAAASLVLWWRSERIGSVAALGLCLAAFVVAGPVVHPWYLLWAVIPLAAGARSRAVRRTVAVGSAALVLLVLPGGVQPGLPALVGAILGASTVLLVATALSGRLPAAPAAERLPDHADASVR